MSQDWFLAIVVRDIGLRPSFPLFLAMVYLGLAHVVGIGLPRLTRIMDWQATRVVYHGMGHGQEFRYGSFLKFVELLLGLPSILMGG